MIELPSKNAFSQALNSVFHLPVEAGLTVDLTLIELRQGVSTAQQEQFSLLFRGPAEPLLPQHIYPVEHYQLGAFDLFFVPVGRDPAGVTYEVVFNRFIV
jgi:hypothetical protein